MFLWTIILLVAGLLYMFSQYYYKPKTQLRRIRGILQKLGYKVYEQPFSFMGFSFLIDMAKGLATNKDALYVEKHIYPSVDVSIGNILNRAVMVIVNPDLTQEFFSSKSNNSYRKFEDMIQGTKEILGNGLVFSEGEEWKTKRKLLSKIFNFQLVRDNIPQISAICKKSFGLLEERWKVDQNKYKYFIGKAGAKMFSGIMMKCFFGYDNLDEEVAGVKYDEFMVDTMSEASQLSETPLVAFFGKLALNSGLTKKIRHVNRSLCLMREKALQILRRRTQEVGEAKKQARSTDIIQALADQKAKSKENFSYNDKELVDEFHTFLIAGTDTTSRYFTMIVYYLGRNPQAADRLRKEVAQIIRREEDITFENLKKLKYMDWVQSETTRLFDVANGMFFRIATQDHFLKDIPISKGTILRAQPTGNHYSEKYFADPFAFRPERWEKECSQLHPFAFMGFGAGPRNCIGKQLAILSSKIALVHFILRYEHFIVPQEITMTADIFYEPLPFDVTMSKKQ